MARAKRICSHTGCPQPADGRYCPTHSREHEARRGTTTARGYGTEHQRARAQAERDVAAGRVRCARCGKPILRGDPFDLGHTDDRTGYLGPEHAGCNRSAGGRAAHGR